MARPPECQGCAARQVTHCRRRLTNRGRTRRMLERNGFETIGGARAIAEPWRMDYSESRPHMARNGVPPGEFARRHQVDPDVLFADAGFRVNFVGNAGLRGSAVAQRKPVVDLAHAGNPACAFLGRSTFGAGVHYSVQIDVMLVARYVDVVESEFGPIVDLLPDFGAK